MSVAPESSQDSNDQPTQPLVSAGSSDRCSVCGAQLAVDQRYCVECGTRRGAPRFSLVNQGSAPAAVSAVRSTSMPSGPGRFFRPTSGSVLLIGLLILLVALGVGVLIGHNGKSTPAKPAAVNVTVNGGGSGGSSGTASANTGASSSSSSTASSGGSSSKSSTKKSSSKSSSGAGSTGTDSGANASASGKAGNAAAASKFSKSATKKSTLGGSCTAGTAGCSNGQQTGNLF